MARSKDIHVCVCVPSTGLWNDDFGKSLALMFSYFAQVKVKGTRTQRMSLLTMRGSMLSFQRHELVRIALKNGATHVFFLDSDMIFPKNILNRLLESKKQVIGCNCTTRVPPILPVAADLKGERLSSIGKHGYEKISHVGMAVFLFEADVVKPLKPPLFMQEWVHDLKATCGEDVYFCMKLQHIGVDIWIDHDASRTIKHIGIRAYGHNDIEDIPDAT